LIEDVGCIDAIIADADSRVGGWWEANVGTKGAHVHTWYGHMQKEENGSRSQIENEKKFFCFLLALRIHQKIAQQNLLAIFSGNGKSCLYTR
jgi:hypothetical protein